MIVKSANYVIGGTKSQHFPTDNLPELLFVGRSNVGKSSFINALCNKTIARTSSNPGKTQVINFFLINEKFYFVDVPGYGYAKVSKTKIEEFGKMIENYITNRETLKAVFLLVDFKVGPTSDDLLMYEFLKFYNKKIYIICTKSDKVNMSNRVKAKKNILSKLDIDESSLLITSSEKKIGIDKILDLIEEIVE